MPFINGTENKELYKDGETLDTVFTPSFSVGNVFVLTYMFKLNLTDRKQLIESLITSV